MPASNLFRFGYCVLNFFFIFVVGLSLLLILLLMLLMAIAMMFVNCRNCRIHIILTIFPSFPILNLIFTILIIELSIGICAELHISCEQVAKSCVGLYVQFPIGLSDWFFNWNGYNFLFIYWIDETNRYQSKRSPQFQTLHDSNLTITKRLWRLYRMMMLNLVLPYDIKILWWKCDSKRKTVKLNQCDGMESIGHK